MLLINSKDIYIKEKFDKEKAEKYFKLYRDWEILTVDRENIMRFDADFISIGDKIYFDFIKVFEDLYIKKSDIDFCETYKFYYDHLSNDVIGTLCKSREYKIEEIRKTFTKCIIYNKYTDLKLKECYKVDLDKFIKYMDKEVDSEDI